MEAIVEVRGVCKTIRGKKILDRIQFEAHRGQCVGIVGPTGAGKTVLLQLVAGMLQPTTGEIFISRLNTRINSQEIRKSMGVVRQELGLELEFTALDNLIIFGGYFGLTREKARLTARALLRSVQLDHQEDHVVGFMTKAQKHRLCLARAMIGDPRLLLLDEPTTGLDYKERLWVRSWINNSIEAGVTVLIATKSMVEAEQICDRVILLDKGQIVCQGEPDQLVANHIGRKVVEYLVEPGDLEYHLRLIGKSYRYQVLDRTIRLFLADTDNVEDAVKSVTSDRIQIRQASLGDVFGKLIGFEFGGEL